jgi:hypothetical protein
MSNIKTTSDVYAHVTGRARTEAVKDSSPSEAIPSSFSKSMRPIFTALTLLVCLANVSPLAAQTKTPSKQTNALSSRAEFLATLQSRTEAAVEIRQLLPEAARGDKNAEKRLFMLGKQAHLPTKLLQRRLRDAQDQQRDGRKENARMDCFLATLSQYARLVFLHQEDSPEAQKLLKQSLNGDGWGHWFTIDFGESKAKDAYEKAKARGESGEKEKAELERIRKVHKRTGNMFAMQREPTEASMQAYEVSLKQMEKFTQGLAEGDAIKVDEARAILEEMIRKATAQNKADGVKEGVKEDESPNNFYADMAQRACERIARLYVETAISKGRESQESQVLWQRLERVGKIAKNTSEENPNLNFLRYAVDIAESTNLSAYVDAVAQGKDVKEIKEHEVHLERIKEIKTFHKIPDNMSYNTIESFYTMYLQNLLNAFYPANPNEEKINKIEQEIRRIEEKFSLKCPASLPTPLSDYPEFRISNAERQLRTALLREWREANPNPARLLNLTEKFILETEKRTNIRYAVARAELLLIAAEVDRLEKQIEKQTESKERIATLKARSRLLFPIVERGPRVFLTLSAPTDALWVNIAPAYDESQRLYHWGDGVWVHEYNDKEDVPTSVKCIIVHRDGRLEKRTITKTTIIPAPRDPYTVKPE